MASPARTPRLAVVFGRLLAAAFLICFATGLYSHFLQDPLPWMVFPTRPVWIYQVTQGVHVTAGIACFPLLFAKLFTVFPELFQSPPVRSFAHLLERASIALFVAASLMQVTIGLLNTYQLYALFGFSFRLTHYALSWILIGSLAIHIGVKLPIIARYWRKRDAYDEAGALVERETDPDAELDVPDELQRLTGRTQAQGFTGRLFAWMDRTPAARLPDDVRDTRRGFLTTIAVATTVLVTTTGGQSFRFLDPFNAFAPRKRGVGPQTLPVNRTAKAAGVLPAATAPEWTLTVINGSTRGVYGRSRLQALPQHDVVLPIACVEGWSQDAAWRGPRLRDLLDSVGAAANARVRITSLQTKGGFAVTEMQPEFTRDPLTLVALELFGEELDIDHGYPARIIAPGRPGVLQTKWLSVIEVIA
ncbi:molybdopterin-dependent oxidoreductase [Microbacterium sulfonylureivorans]|uniref:molybdopterin-dependent oxidoreductase n=1 Tax=Microbacterium sulfonylureivorans TaxID=2486854 RepID=UPI001F0CA179|nr:molybdopterin-dependent oxidoreductase [Microbacterium sulfonylureivorans]